MKTNHRTKTAATNAATLRPKPEPSRRLAASLAVAFLASLLASPLAGADLSKSLETLPAPLDDPRLPDAPGAPDPVMGLLILDAAVPENPIVAYSPGTEPRAQVQVLNATPNAGGFSIIDPAGAYRFTNQFSNLNGLVDFFEVSMETPNGEWTITQKPGLPAVSPERKPDEATDPRYDPSSYAEEVLLRFRIDGPRALAASSTSKNSPPEVRVETVPDNATLQATFIDVALPLGLPDLMQNRASSGTYYEVDPSTGYYGPDGYVFCATEGQYCKFSDTRDVAYGGNGYYSYKYGVTGGIACTNSAFGDPYYGYQKACYTKPRSTYVGPSGYAFCAYENQYCSFTGGARDVAYGNNGYYYYRYGVTGGINCSNSVFGDPLYGTGKACWTIAANTGSGAGTSTHVGPSGYTYCVDEGQYCAFTGSKNVAYGANGYFYYKTASDGVSCSNSVFGDPLYGVKKACYTYGGSSTQTGCTNWQLKASHLKWINTVVSHAPYAGSAEALLAGTSTTDEYWFGSGSTIQTVTGETLSTTDGKTTGLYKLMTASYYTCDVGLYKVVLSNPPQPDSMTQALYGSSQTTDADDVTEFWAYSTSAGQSIQSVTLYHQFQAVDDARTLGSTGENCRWTSSQSGKVMGVDLSISFTPPGSTVGVSGTLAYKTAQSSTSSYKYCFGNDHRYEWDNLGGTGSGADNLAAAFRLVW